MITNPATLTKTDPLASTGATCILGFGTAVPAYIGAQNEACAFMERTLAASGQNSTGERALLRRIYSKSGIEKRYTVLRDYVEPDPSRFEFFPPNAALDPFPGTAARMEVYERESVGLAVQAASAALGDAGLEAAQVTHLVISTCTGFFAPGPDVLLVRDLGLREDVQRTILGFMGCHAGLSGLRVANDIVKGDSRAVVLQVCVELCSLHYQKTPTPVTMVANALFADGAAATVYAGAGQGYGDQALATVRTTRCCVAGDTLDRMSWRIGDAGFVMTLDPALPELLKGAAPDYVEAMAEAAEVSVGEISHWAIHPGGRKILEAVGECLGLSHKDLLSSYDVLRNYGNMSSATILFVLDRELRREDREPGLLAAMAFGPGLTIEGCLLERL